MSPYGLKCSMLELNKTQTKQVGISVTSNHRVDTKSAISTLTETKPPESICTIERFPIQHLKADRPHLHGLNEDSTSLSKLIPRRTLSNTAAPNASRPKGLASAPSRSAAENTAAATELK
ncbi:hypothetical protein AVEN_232386-1 [Araneus ventricosus]|uniref:Uncharacterized protein n=1 Tax=Araneus ventricosus TaxID=182803 RepID=A0A4Y2CVH5_ARAVE|nr:hypothetical protein AVEN_232386-1 [Araneus ventricosus]